VSAGSSDERLQASREWHATYLSKRASSQFRGGAGRSDQPLTTPISDSVVPEQSSTPERAAEWRSGPRQAAEACKRLHQVEAEQIDALLAGRRVGKFRRGSGFKNPPKNNLDRNFIARVWFVAKMIEQKSWNCRAKGKHGGSIGTVGIEVLRTLLYVIKKIDGRLYPSIEAIAKLSRKSKQAVITAIRVLEHMGFLTVHKRLKWIQTPYGRRAVQDSNAYEFHLPATGIGALAMAVFCRPSESTKLDAIKHTGESPTGSELGSAVKRLADEGVDRWWLPEPLQAGNGGWR
jgi:hypothetical protein